ncbi:hypothetical protein [Streptomyces sp. NPDC053560]|uniref:hypothetical protein n=1 Tax=Streptomyces sp. NPDC053560 TaxID=3365711 RepID=UPI0037CF68CF
MGCSFSDPFACPGDLVKWGADKVTGGAESVAKSAFGGAVRALAQAIGEAVDSAMHAMNGLWIDVDASGVYSGETSYGEKQKLIEQGESPIHAIQGQLNWLVGYVAVAALLIAAIRMALDRKGQTMQQAFHGMWRVVLVSGAAVMAMQALTTASDRYAEYIYDKAYIGSAGAQVVGGGVMALGPMAATSPGLVIILGLLAVLAITVQIILMYLRIGVLVMLVGTLPLAAAASMTGWGSGWWKKHIGWLVAWLLYKPAAALIFYAGTVMTKNTDDLNQVIAGLGVLILGVFALPALLKLVVPATAALGDTSGGSVAVNAANNIATGAVSIAGGSVGGGGGGGGAGAGSGGGGGGGASTPKGSPSSGAGASAGGGGAAGGGAGAAGGGAASAAGGAATAGAATAAQAAAVAVQTGVQAASEVVNSLGDNDGNKGHNE